MTLLKLNKKIIFSLALMMIGSLAMIDTAFANYGYKSSYKSSYKHNYKKSYNNYSSYRSSYKSNRSYSGHSRSQRSYKYNSYYSRKHNNYNSRSYRKYSYTSPYNSYGNVNKRAYKKYKEPFAGYKGNQHHSKTVSHCYDYIVTTRGGRGGFRFQHNIDDFKRIDSRTHVSQICGRDSVEFELSKLDPTVSVSIEIGGKQFHYPANSGHDKLINNWHRKYFSVSFLK